MSEYLFIVLPEVHNFQQLKIAELYDFGCIQECIINHIFALIGWVFDFRILFKHDLNHSEEESNIPTGKREQFYRFLSMTR